MSKKARRRKKAIRRLITYMVIGTITTFSVLFYVNNNMLSNKLNIVEVNSKSYVANAQGVSEQNKPNITVPNNAKCVAPTFDGEYITYLDSGILYIKDADTNKIVKEINEGDPIAYSIPLSDRDIILYFVYHNNKIDVKTYDMSNQEIINNKTFLTSNFYKIVDVKFSSYTNMIYVNAEKETAAGFTNTIYRINIMSTVTLYTTYKKIASMQLLNNKDTLIYQNDNNDIYIGRQRFYYNGESHFKLLGIDSQDNIYLMTLDSNPQIYVVNNGSVIDTQSVDDPNFIGIYNKNNKIDLIYSNYMYDVINKEKINIEPNAKIIYVNNSNITYETQNDEIITQKISAAN